MITWLPSFSIPFGHWTIMLPGFMASWLCRLIVIQRGDGSVNMSLFPAGTCALCCPIELDRDVEYQLYTRRNPLRPHILKPSNPWSLKRSNFDKNVPTVVYIHGYGERAPGRSSMAIRDAYLRRGRYNVILVDWGKLSALPWYITAVGNSRSVGPHVGRMVRWLEHQGAVPMSRLHVIGFSLGAEVAGFMGKSLAPRKIARITGLDAAYPLYMNTGSQGHLAASDATFVDVIHTDGGIFGFLRPLGHADFYPNGGRPLQPGCSLGSLISMGVARLLNQYIVCGHNRAWRFYAESVTNPYGFPASRCRKWPPDSPSSCTWSPVALMGITTDPRLRGELYVEDLNERRIVSIRMGWLWVESTQMRLPLRALNLRQAAPSICQPHVLALGFTLTNSQGNQLATFWADTEPIYWSWVRAIAAELVRQTPFRAQRCLNFLEILTICPRGPLPLPESPTETRRRSRSELRCWLGTTSLGNDRVADAATLLDSSRRRARSELRGWSSSNSSDEDLHLAEYRSIQAAMLPKVEATIERRIWGCSESSEGSDDSLPWGGAGCRSSVDSIDSAPSLPEPVDTREQRIQRYKEARRRENEARSRRVLEEDAKRRKARREENNNNNNNNNTENNVEKSVKSPELTELKSKCTGVAVTATPADNGTSRNVEPTKRNSVSNLQPLENPEAMKKSIWTCHRSKGLSTNVESNGKSTVDSATNRKSVKPLKASAATTDPFVRAAETVDAITRRLPPLKVSLDMSQTIVRFKEGSGPHRQDTENNNNRNNNNNNKASNNNTKNNYNRDISTRYKAESPPSPCVMRTDSGERRSRARERRNVRERCQISLFHQPPSDNRKTSFLDDRKERLSLSSRIPIVGNDFLRTSSNSRLPGQTARVSNNKEFFHLEKDCRKRDAISLPRITDKITTVTLTTLTTTTTTTTPIKIHDVSTSPSTCEEDVAKLLARCQRVDHYVPVREKLTLFESLSRLGGRLARSTEDLGRSASKPSPRGKQRARSLHDLNRAVRSVPVREMCRFFEGDPKIDSNSTSINPVPRLHETSISFAINCNKDSPVSILKNSHHLQDPPPCVRTSSRRKHYQK